MNTSLSVIAVIQTDFDSKFGIPRQSGIITESPGMITLMPPYRSPEAVRGLEEYSHLWLIWLFSENMGKGWNPTVRPPKLGGNTRMGVFATRSPFRPNPLGLSSVRLLGIDYEGKDAPRLRVSGADLMNGTPIVDIKPYIPYTDIHADATGGFARPSDAVKLDVSFPDELLSKVPEEKRQVLMEVLAQDPRPGYAKDETRVYGMTYAGLEIRFRVIHHTLEITEVTPC